MAQSLWGLWIVLAVPYAASCNSAYGTAETEMKELQGKWVLESIDGNAVETTSDIYFEIDGNTISGFDGCNRFGGSLDAPERMRMTQRACPPEMPRLPLDLSAPRRQLESSRLDGDTLEVDLVDDAGTAKFRRTKPIKKDSKRNQGARPRRATSSLERMAHNRHLDRRPNLEISRRG